MIVPADRLLEVSDLQADMDAAIDHVLELLERPGAEYVDPLTTIVARLQARGGEIDLSTAPPLMRMLLEGMLA